MILQYEIKVSKVPQGLGVQNVLDNLLVFFVTNKNYCQLRLFFKLFISFSYLLIKKLRSCGISLQDRLY